MKAPSEQDYCHYKTEISVTELKTTSWSRIIFWTEILEAFWLNMNIKKKIPTLVAIPHDKPTF